MAEPISIDIFRNKDSEEFTSALEKTDSKLYPGSAAAQCAASAAAVANRAAVLVSEVNSSDEIDYIIRNTEILRNYMVHLIDEDIKCKGPMRRALKEGGENEIEAARHPACAICGEIINMMVHLFDFLSALKPFASGECLVFIRQSAYFAYCAMCVAREYVLDLASSSADETFRFVTVRENEITFENCEKIFSEITG